MIKPSTTFSEQLTILENRNLIIDDKDAAQVVLKKINYYRLSAYMLTFKSDDTFFNNTTLEDIYDMILIVLIKNLGIC